MAVAGFQHLGLKVVSIALALLLWLVVAGEPIVERVLRVPLEFTNLPSGLEIVGGAPNLVDVRVRGSAGALSRVATGEVAAVLDLQTAKAGPPRLFHLGPEDVRVPFGVEVVQVTPSTISMTFEPSVSKTVPVVPEIEGTPAEGYAVATVTAEPATVEVIGPASAVESTSQAITEPVSVTGATTTITESATIGTADPLVRLRQPQTARVTIRIVAAPVEWAVRNVPLRVLNGGPGVEVQPRTVTVYVRGQRDAMQAAPAAFDASVDAAGLAPGQHLLPVRVVPPQRLAVVRVEPAQARVRITK